MRITTYLGEDEFVSLNKLLAQYHKQSNLYRMSEAAVRTLHQYYVDLDAATGKIITRNIGDIMCDWSEYSVRDLIGIYGYLTGDTDPSIAQVVVSLQTRAIVIPIRHYDLAYLTLEPFGYLVNDHFGRRA